jgi:phosphomannomutase
MDDTTTATAQGVYRCPGHDDEIDRSTHLARLADFYPPCRGCPHRREVALLSAARRRDWAEIERRPHAAPTFTQEALEAASANELTPLLAGRLAMSLGVALNGDVAPIGKAPSVVVGADGHWHTAELVAAACHAIQRAGCDAIETGTVTSASLALAARRAGAAAALWIGNIRGLPHTIGVKFWGPHGQPWSSPGGLDPIRERFEAGVDRPTRRGGNLARLPADDAYLEPLRPLFHALRPLRLALETTCEPLVAYLEALTVDAACQIARMPRAAQAISRDRARAADDPTAALGRQVVAAGAHGGLWTSGDGECLQVLDELGAKVSDDAVWLAMARYVCHERPDATLVVDETSHERLRPWLAGSGARIATSAPTREALHRVMEAERAILGHGPGGQYWFAGEAPSPDALLAINLLLTILSQTDRPISEALRVTPPMSA